MCKNGSMTTDVIAPGLRERKRLVTRRSIQLAVLDLVAERGLEGVTVDEVSRIADISPRTFFNYFASKEEALMGNSPELPSGEQVERFVTGGSPGSLLDDITALLISAGEASSNDVEIFHRRHALLKQYPHLFAMRMATMRVFEEEVAAVIARRLSVDDATLAADPHRLGERARLITLVSFAAMRHAWTSWALGESPSKLTERLTESFGELKTLFSPSQG
jgi:AcrR family transcriptional regulator